MSNKITRKYNFRIDYSKNYSKYHDIITNYFKISLIIDKKCCINSFQIPIKNKKINYNLYYTSPYNNNDFDYNILYDNDYFNKTPVLIKNICKKIFIYNYNIDDYEYFIIEKICSKKMLYKPYITLYYSFLIVWYIIINDIYIKDKKYFLNILSNNYKDFYYGEFKIKNIINKIINNKKLDEIKINLMLYIFLEEYHYNYYINHYSKLLNKKKLSIINTNYISINPLEILNNINSECVLNLNDIIDYIECPIGHSIILIIKNHNIYYYDSDEINYIDFNKLKIFFKNISFNLLNVSSKKPIQTIYDDYNCIFYSLRLIEFIDNNNFEINYNNLKKYIHRFENNIYILNDMNNWINNFIISLEI